MKFVDYQDFDGIWRRVSVPDSFDGDPREGIPVSLDVTTLFSEASPEFRRRLSEELHAQNLMMPQDFLLPGSLQKIRACLLSVLDRDSLSIQAFAKERLTNV